MSKKYKNKTCAYCNDNLSITGDHVFAREFFLIEHRGKDLPRVPSCDSCNNKKSRLEHYLTSILPFGGKHCTAKKNLKTMVPKRLSKNRKLHRKLASNRDWVWVLQESELYTRHTCFKFDGEKLLQLFEYIGKGLYWHHIKSPLSGDTDVKAKALTKYDIDYFKKHFFTSDRFNYYAGNCGDGTFKYKGMNDPLNPDLSCWVISIYGGIQMYENTKESNEISDAIGVITLPEFINEKLIEKLNISVQGTAQTLRRS